MSKLRAMPVGGAGQVQALYVQHHAWLQNWFRRELGCPHQAADLSQDTFVRVLTRGESEPPIEEPRAFLATLARRVLFSFLRRRSLESAWLEALEAQPHPLALSAEDYAAVREAVEAVDRLLQGLPPRVKQAFLLNRLEGMTHVRIAAELGISVATVERHVKQAYLHCLACGGEAS